MGKGMAGNGKQWLGMGMGIRMGMASGKQWERMGTARKQASNGNGERTGNGNH